MGKFWNRLRHDAQLALITTAGMLGLLSLVPFALYRWWQGDLVMVAVDAPLAAVTAFALYLSWVHGKTQLAGHILAVLYAGAATVVAIHLPVSGLYWFYCVVLFNFFILPPIRSTILTLVTLALICLWGLLHPGTVFSDLQHLIEFTTTCLICSLFAYMFAWRTTRQRRMLQKLANMDPLTGIGNRRTLMEEMDIALASYRRHGTQCGLLLLDIDHFKRINDNYGHVEGDRVLVELAHIIWRSSRRTDRLFRLGGEEFVLLLPNIGPAGLETAARNIVSTVAESLRSHDQQITVSIGGSLLEPDDDGLSWMHRADVCMYQAKNDGRNRSRIHSTAAERTTGKSAVTGR